MHRTRIFAVAVLIVASIQALHMAQARQQRLKRGALVRDHLTLPERELVQLLVELAPAVLAPRSLADSEEIVYVVEGLLEYRRDDGAPVTLEAGEVPFIERGAGQSPMNVGSGAGARLEPIEPWMRGKELSQSPTRDDALDNCSLY